MIFDIIASNFCFRSFTFLFFPFITSISSALYFSAIFNLISNDSFLTISFLALSSFACASFLFLTFSMFASLAFSRSASWRIIYTTRDDLSDEMFNSFDTTMTVFGICWRYFVSYFISIESAVISLVSDTVGLIVESYISSSIPFPFSTDANDLDFDSVMVAMMLLSSYNW